MPIKVPSSVSLTYIPASYFTWAIPPPPFRAGSLVPRHRCIGSDRDLRIMSLFSNPNRLGIFHSMLKPIQDNFVSLIDLLAESLQTFIYARFYLSHTWSNYEIRFCRTARLEYSSQGRCLTLRDVGPPKRTTSSGKESNNSPQV